MARRRGGLSLLAILAIFVVVLGLMYGGVRLANGELLPGEPADAREDALRSAIRERIDDLRAARGLAPAANDRFQRGIAQDTATAIASSSYFDAPTAAGVAAGDGGLPNARPFCTQLPAKLTLSDASGAPANRSTNATAAAVVDLFADAKGRTALFRPAGQFRTALGVVIEDGAVHVVYRSCPKMDT